MLFPQLRSQTAITIKIQNHICPFILIIFISNPAASVDSAPVIQSPPRSPLLRLNHYRFNETATTSPRKTHNLREFRGTNPLPFRSRSNPPRARLSLESTCLTSAHHLLRPLASRSAVARTRCFCIHRKLFNTLGLRANDSPPSAPCTPVLARRMLSSDTAMARAVRSRQ